MDATCTPEVGYLIISGLRPTTNDTREYPPSGLIEIAGLTLARPPVAFTFLNDWYYNACKVLVYEKTYNVIDTLEDGVRTFVALQGGVRIVAATTFEGLIGKLYVDALGQAAFGDAPE